MRILTKNLKDIATKLSIAVEDSKINPRSGWVEIHLVNNKLNIRVGNYDYFLESIIETDGDCGDEVIHGTVTAKTLLPLVAKIENEYIDIEEKMNAIVITTSTSSYQLPIIKENGFVKELDVIDFDDDKADTFKIDSNYLVSIAEKNVKGLISAKFSRDFQQFIYMDNIGALTFTENIYVNDFEKAVDGEFKVLFNDTQAELMRIFKDCRDVTLSISNTSEYNSSRRVKISANNTTLVLITQSMEMVDKFPAIKLRSLAEGTSDTHAVIDKKTFEKALARLMIFDKKFGPEILNYSKLQFKEMEVVLVSIKSGNFETVPYINGTNTFEHEAMIRFADLQTQVKAIQDTNIDIGYGEDSKAITFNTDGLKQLIPVVMRSDV